MRRKKKHNGHSDQKAQKRKADIECDLKKKLRNRFGSPRWTGPHDDDDKTEFFQLFSSHVFLRDTANFF